MRPYIGRDPPSTSGTSKGDVYLGGWAPAGDDQATSARRHGCDRRPRRIPGLAMARSAAGRRLDRMARRPPPAGREGQGPGCLSNVATRRLSWSRPASAIAATPPMIAAIGPKDTAASCTCIAEPIRMAAIPPTAVNVCLSLCMTGSLPVLLKIQLLRPLCHLAGRWGGDDLSRRGALDGLVEEIFGCVRHQCDRADGTGGRGREPSNGVQPLDVSSLRQLVAAGWSVLGSNHLQQVPGNRTRLDGDGGNGPGPDLARILRVLPRGAGQAILKRVGGLLKRVGAEEVGDDLLIMLVEQGGLRPEECPPRGQADVVLRADGVTLAEHLVPGWDLKNVGNVGGHGWLFGIVGTGRRRL